MSKITEPVKISSAFPETETLHQIDLNPGRLNVSDELDACSSSDGESINDVCFTSGGTVIVEDKNLVTSPSTVKEEPSPIGSSPATSESQDRDDHTEDDDGFTGKERENLEPSPPSNNRRGSSKVWQEIVDDFDPSRGGDRKILRAIGRTATVNAVVTATAALGPLAAVAGYATGGAITAKRLVGDGLMEDNPREVAKSLAVFGSATSASLAGQAVTGALAIGVLGASLPLAGALAFGAGCVSGITAGALSEWGVDGVLRQNHPEGPTPGETPAPDEPDATKAADAETKATVPKDSEAIHRTKQAKGALSTSQPPMARTNNNFVQVCGAWVKHRREMNRQRRIEREKAKQMEVLALASAPQTKETENITTPTNSATRESSSDA